MSGGRFLNDYQGVKSPDVFHRNGHPGKWLRSLFYSGSVNYTFTGSLPTSGAPDEGHFGAGGIIFTVAGDATIELSDGGTIPASALELNMIHELSIKNVTSTTGEGYVLYRNQLVH